MSTPANDPARRRTVRRTGRRASGGPVAQGCRGLSAPLHADLLSPGLSGWQGGPYVGLMIVGGRWTCSGTVGGDAGRWPDPRPPPIPRSLSVEVPADDQRCALRPTCGQLALNSVSTADMVL